jgi:hypothetical protein
VRERWRQRYACGRAGEEEAGVRGNKLKLTKCSGVPNLRRSMKIKEKRAIDFQIPLKLIISIKILNYFNNVYLFEENHLLVSKVNTELF